MKSRERGRSATLGFAANSLLLTLALTACVTEKAPRHHAPVGGEVLPTAPLATRVDPSRSTNSAAKVALQPLGLIPYDGNALPVISSDGNHIATQIGTAPPDAGEPQSVEIFDATHLPMRSVRTDPRQPIVLASGGDAEGFFVFRSDPARERIQAKVLFDGSIVDAPHPPLDPRVKTRITRSDRESMLAHALASIDQSPMGAVVFYDPDSARMTAWMPREAAPVLLAKNSIAACWAGTSPDPSVLITTADGLFLQRLSHDSTGWRAENPVRLLREPFVPRSTTNPERSYILIGPGPKDKPHMLQVMAMQLIE
ncbi:MAG: hypothetical protein JNK58_03250 [Phycisphaerae bacterium]|nr:hypothetical protein [Phycisphaerae bacterium]